jgi:CPA1 family monovalent cation:H+ antiporter
MPFEMLFVTLFSVATAVAIFARWLKIPYTVALVATGLVLGVTHAVRAPHLTKELLYAIILPGLLFEAAFHLDAHRFWRNRTVIFSLAIPGVIAATVLTAALLTPTANALHFVDGFTFLHGLVFGALIAATDPIAVVALFKSLGAPRRLAVLVEGESLLNDGTAVVLFGIVLAAAMGGQTSVAGASLGFIRVVGLGLLVGAGVGYALSKVIQQIDDPMIEITLTTIAAYGSFVAAEQFHASGVIATVTAGMLCGNYAARTGMSPTTRIAVETFWEYLAFGLNSVVFLLIGLEVRLAAVLASWKAILAAFAAVTLGRAIVSFVVSALLRPTRERLPWSWSAVLTWGGIRGGLSMVLVLGLPDRFPHRELLVTMTFGVVVLSILLQGLTMGPVLRWLRLVNRGEDRADYEERRGALRAAQAAQTALDRLASEGLVDADVAATLRQEYRLRAEAEEAAIRSLHLERGQLREEELRTARRQLLMAEKDELMAARHHGALGAEPFQRLVADVDGRLFRLEEEAAAAPPAATVPPSSAPPASASSASSAAPATPAAPAASGEPPGPAAPATPAAPAASGEPPGPAAPAASGEPPGPAAPPAVSG